jgi:flagellar motility protein MotE (MotC chaperone)
LGGENVKKIRTIACSFVLLMSGTYAAAAETKPEKKPDLAEPAEPHDHAAEGEHAEASKAHPLSLESHTNGCPLCPVNSPEEMDVLMTLRERHAQVSARELMAEKKEAELTQLEQRIDKRVAKLDDAMAKLEARLDLAEPGRAIKEERIKGMVETLSGLTAKKAAPILAEAEPEVAAELLRRLGATRAAALLAVMPATKAGRFISLGLGKIAAPPQSKSAPTPAPKENNG